MQLHMLFYQKLYLYLISICIILILLYYGELITLDFSFTETSKNVTGELNYWKESQNTNEKLFALSDCMDEDLNSVEIVKNGKFVACAGS